jgi:response regulator RpfG family c-di-GMP phosphodiesterase
MPAAPIRPLSRSASATTIHGADKNAAYYVHELIAASLVLGEEWQNLSAEVREELINCTSKAVIRARLVELGLLTDYQASRLEAGTTHGLVLGSYRVLNRLGAGNMGVVFKAEHRRLRRIVALKVLPVYPQEDLKLLDRFFTEMRAVANLQHPNIVSALDAGETAPTDASSPTLHYFVMEYVPGEDLEEYVSNHGPLSVVKACDLIHQTASALAEAHKHNLVHRDIKPSNIRVTPEEQAKLLDFGLTRQLRHRLTTPGTILGTLDYMAPEQTQDASAVDIRADIYGLGGTLFWALTGRAPFQMEGSVVEAVARRLTQGPPSAREVNSEIPAELDAVIRRMMALKPDDRYTSPEAVMQALLPFMRPEMREHHLLSSQSGYVRIQAAAAARAAGQGHKVLIVDDEAGIRQYCHFALESQGLCCEEAENGQLGLDAAAVKAFDLVLLDINMPKLTGLEVLRQLRKQPPVPHLKIIMFSGQATSDEMAQMLLAGADGYLTKPFSIVQLVGQVKAALRLKDAQSDCDLLNRRLLSINADLERNLSERSSDLLHARNALVLALATLVAQRDGETGGHVVRLQRYCRCFSEEAANLPTFANQIDANFVDMLDCCSPLHDIGKVGLPDYILLKPGRLTPDERMLMETHTIIGADTLTQVAKRHGSSLVFLKMAIDIARHHHERFDGKGYPDRLTGTQIPLAARIVALADVYDALRSRRVYKPALSHASTKHVIVEGSPGHFDPALLEVFQRCAASFERIFNEWTD